MRKNRGECEISFSEAQDIVEGDRPRARFTTKLFFWLFVVLTILTAFLFWSVQGKVLLDETSPVGINLSFFAGIISLCLAIFFAIVCFIRFIRSRSIAGGLFLTTAISTAIFLGTSQLLPVLIPTTAAAFSVSPDVTTNNLQVIIGLAQIGLFSLWFMFILTAIYMNVRPVRKIDDYLQKILDGEQIDRIKIGKAKQYRGIEEKLEILSAENSERLEREYQRREQSRARREQRQSAAPK